MSKEYSDAQIREFASQDFVISARCPISIPWQSYTEIQSWLSQFILVNYGNETSGTERPISQANISHFLQRFPHNKRVVGLINGDNHDGSFNITLLSDNLTINVNTAKVVSMGVTCKSEGVYDDDKIGTMRKLATWEENAFAYFNGTLIDDVYDFVPEWQTPPQHPDFYRDFAENTYDNTDIQTFTLTRDKNASMNVGVAKSGPYMDGSFLDYLPTYGKEIYERIAGDVWELCSNTVAVVGASVEGHDKPPAFSLYNVTPIPGMTIEVWDGQIIEEGRHWFSAWFKPYNIPLTRSYQQALRYLDSDIIPDDCIIYPWDPDEFPKYQNEDNPDEGENDGDDEPDETNKPIRAVDDMPDGDPDVTPQSLSNNNLYWLSAQQLEDFISWFWHDAGEVIDTSSLWQKIQGLFNDLASAIINIRYMPVDISWIGGKVPVNGIDLAMITYTSASQIFAINKVNPVKQTIGEIDIKEEISAIKTKNGFLNFSPYAQLSLYLPFHGFVDLDNDIFMGTKLRVKALYDIISGVIQYEIYSVYQGNQTLINAIPCKMAVDIPITLQSKGDRDSAIFQNVASLAGTAITGVAGAVSGNPIGLVMGVSSFASGVASAGSQSAPMSVKGSVQESGAFYSPTRCAIFISRPVYNRPTIYKSRVGYPCNKGYKLSSKNITGFTQCHNPKINFSGNSYTDDGINIKIYPTQTEVDEIYDYLSKGVIL